MLQGRRFTEEYPTADLSAAVPAVKAASWWHWTARRRIAVTREPTAEASRRVASHATVERVQDPRRVSGGVRRMRLMRSDRSRYAVIQPVRDLPVCHATESELLARDSEHLLQLADARHAALGGASDLRLLRRTYTVLC
ncbi:hypothetical protein GCM10020218_093300 [Dactylosporangium vinaceum]